MSPEPHNPVEVFYSYAHEDEKLRDELKKHLSNLKRQGVITDWYDRDISAGTEWNEEIEKHLNSAKVILLLISPDFMDSDYINNVEVKRAMKRHEAGQARVIPVILRPVDWQGAPFSKLQALPTDAKPVKTSDDPDEAFLDIIKGVRKAILELSGPSASIPTVLDIPRPPKVGFVSRRDKNERDIVERLREELAPEKHQLVALWGAGGVGKTTLAAEAVRALVETHDQRVIWISADARPNFAFSTLLDDIAEQLGRIDLRPLAVNKKEDALRPLINAQPTLIILDNLETITPEQEVLCKEFLARRVHCPALITTRERIEGALLIPIAAMSPVEATEFLSRLVKQSSDPELFEVVDRERILREAEYNPLITEWIVAQIDLAQDPEEVLADLAHGEGDAANRVFNRSYNLPQLNDGGRAVLLALALFTPSAGRPMLGVVAGMDFGLKRDKDRFKKAQEVLASLWLIKKEDGGLRLSVAGLTRELTKARLLNDLRGKTFPQRFISLFSKYAETHKSRTQENYNALSREKDNLLTATELAVAHKAWQSARILAWVLADSPSGMLNVRGYWEDALWVAQTTLTLARRLHEELEVAFWSHNMAAIYHDRGDLDEARKLYNESLAIKTRLKQDHGLAATLHELGSLSQQAGDYEEARRLYGESMIIEKRHGDELALAGTLHQLGWLSQEEGNFREARKLYKESLEITSKIRDESAIANTLHQLGTLAQDEGDYVEARRLYGLSLTTAEEFGNQSSLAASFHQLGTLHLAEKKYQSAEELLDKSLMILRNLGDKLNSAECLESLGRLRVAQDRLLEAEQLFDEALGLANSLNIPFRIAHIKHSQALLKEKTGDFVEANKLLNEALSTMQTLRSPKAKVVRADLERIEGKTSEVK